MTKTRKVSTLADILAIEGTILETVDRSIEKLMQLLRDKRGLDVLGDLKFLQVGVDPLDPSRQLNFIEQLNQTFTCLVTLKAAAYLLKLHPKAAPFGLNLGAAGGIDVISEDGTVAAEAFAATTPHSNDKLKKEIKRLESCKAKHRYIFFYSPTWKGSLPEPESVRIIPLDSIRILPRLPTFDGGRPLVDVANRNALYDAMEGPEFLKRYR